MKKFLKRKLGALLGYEAELEKARMQLVAIDVAVQCNTRASASQQRLKKDSPWWCETIGSVHAAVDREISLIDQLRDANERFSYSVSARDNLREALSRKTKQFDDLNKEIDGKLELSIDAQFRASEAHVLTMANFQTALERIEDMVKGDDGQAFKEAEKFLNRFRSTKNCIKCGSVMIAMHDEDKKLCSNGACGHEIEWKLEEGQTYQYKRDVEAFVEDRSSQPVNLDD